MTAEEVDIMTTGTFRAICSSEAFINMDYFNSPVRMTDIMLNRIKAYGGLAVVDAYIRVTQPIDSPGKGYSGVHVIEDFITGKKIHLKATGPGTDYYVRKSIVTHVTLDDLNEAYLYNPRNLYQNYEVAINTSYKTLHTYMGKLLSNMKNATYSSAGKLSLLLNDPHLDIIGMGTKIFLVVGERYVAWQGTQFSIVAEEVNGVPVKGPRTLALVGDMKGMDPRFLKALDITGHGISIALGIGVPIPVLNEDVMRRCAVSNEEIFVEMTNCNLPSNRTCMQMYSYTELHFCKVEYQEKNVKTSSLSSLIGARKMVDTLKDWIEHGKFLLNQPSLVLPREGRVKPLIERSE